ncbi:alpha/beta hydrolase [Anaeromicropila herbilytica]|uniref:Alpha/beta hydrolase n=1 Tax=Anaeromicropila herbilytica TaxID=2785025 RepID=A0A7R7EQQ6_9FIRM|nr:alpha/beta hydrolase [Anaeromicropila herbilytica]BCN33020.1 hypothetical protein bsdtb5_43150 [Anaeromicropila herbilytica]
MNKKKKFSLILLISCLSVMITYFINKMIFLLSTLKETLYSDNSNYYNWRFGKVFYTKKGIGTPILLIHDLNCTSSDYEWKEIIGELSKTHSVYTIDLIGCGRSEKPKMIYTNYLYVQLISDFIKNVIKQKTNIIATGKSVSPIIMACYSDSQLFNNLLFINPEDISLSNKLPKAKNRLLKYLIDFPLIGTSIYNYLFSKIKIRQTFYSEYFSNTKKIKNKYISAYHEAAHYGGPSSRYLYTSISCHYTNINIVHALKEINNSIYMIGGMDMDHIESIFDEYVNYNSSIETLLIPNTKYLPQLEDKYEVLTICDIFFS